MTQQIPVADVLLLLQGIEDHVLKTVDQIRDGLRGLVAKYRDATITATRPRRKRRAHVRHEEEKEDDEGIAEPSGDESVVEEGECTDDCGSSELDGDEEGEEEEASGPYIMSPEQEVVVQHNVRCCQLYGRAANVSPPGEGKTNITVEVARHLNLPILCIGLAGTMPDKWRRHASRQSVHLLDYVSWDSLRGAQPAGTDQKDISSTPHVSFEVPLNHGWLTRHDTWTGKWRVKVVYSRKRDGTKLKVKREAKVYDTAFFPTQQLTEAIARGLAVVPDEVHKAKNDSMQNQALSVIVGEIFKHTTNLLSPGINGSCVIALSATVMDQPKQAVHILKTLGMLPAVTGSLFSYDRSTGRYETNSGSVRRLMNLCRDLDATAYQLAETEALHNTRGYIYQNKTTGLVVPTGSITAGPNGAVKEPLAPKDRPDWFMFMLYTLILQQQIASGVKNRFDGDAEVELDYRNVIYRIDAQKQARFDELSGQLRDLVAAGALAEETEPARRELESLKQDIFVREPKRILDENPNSKVFILLNFIDGIEAIAKEFESYGSAMIYGGISDARRAKAQKDFQARNTKLRVLVGQITAATAGIDLHDITGRFPRYTFISPSALATDIQQGMMRTKRKAVKGKVTLRIVYGGAGEIKNQEEDERKVADEAETMSKLLRKSRNIKAVAQQQVENGVPFPSDLPTYREQADGSFTLQVIDFAAEEAAEKSSGGEVRSESPMDLTAQEFAECDGHRIAVKPVKITDSKDEPVAVVAKYKVGDLVCVHSLVHSNSQWDAGTVTRVLPGNYEVLFARQQQRSVILASRISLPTERELAEHASRWHVQVPVADELPALETADGRRHSPAEVMAMPLLPPSLICSVAPTHPCIVKQEPLRSAFDVLMRDNAAPLPPVKKRKLSPAAISVPPKGGQKRSASTAQLQDRALAGARPASANPAAVTAAPPAPVDPVVVSITKANTWACLSNSWPLDTTPDAAIAVIKRFGNLPKMEQFGFKLHGKFYPTVVHFVHSNIAPADVAARIMQAETAAEVRKLWPLSTATHGMAAPHVQRLYYQGMLAKHCSQPTRGRSSRKMSAQTTPCCYRKFVKELYKVDNRH